MAERMHAGVLRRFGRMEWKRVPKPKASGDEVLLRVQCASICGTDQHVYAGEFGDRVRLPLIPGHEFAGIVEETGQDVEGFRPGDRVVADPILWCGECEACRIGHPPACRSLRLLGIDLDGGFAEFVTVPASNLHVLPETLPMRHAALTEIYAIGFHATNRAGVRAGDTVVVWGAGKVGQSILQAVQTRTKGRVFIVDVLQARLDLARSIVPDVVAVNALEVDPVSAVREVTGGEGVDVAFEAVGHARDIPGRAHPVRGCIQSIRGAGTVCVLGLSDRASPLSMKELIFKEAKIVASRVSHGEYGEVLERLAGGSLKPDPLISAVLHPQEINEGFRMLESSPESYLKLLIDFQDAR